MRCILLDLWNFSHLSSNKTEHLFYHFHNGFFAVYQDYVNELNILDKHQSCDGNVKGTNQKILEVEFKTYSTELIEI